MKTDKALDKATEAVEAAVGDSFEGRQAADIELFVGVARTFCW